MIVDASLLVYAVNRDSPQHAGAHQWLTHALHGPARVGLPWASLGAFIRITTHPRIMPRPLTSAHAADYVRTWLKAPSAWAPEAGAGYSAIFTGLVARHEITGNLVPDALLAALALEHGVPVASTDADFARWPEVTWINPLAPAPG